MSKLAKRMRSASVRATTMGALVLCATWPANASEYTGDETLLRNPHECLNVRLAPKQGGSNPTGQAIRIENTCSFPIQFVGCLEAQSQTSGAAYSCSNTPSRVEDPNMGDLIVNVGLRPGDYHQILMSDGTSPNLFSSGSFAVCRVADYDAPYVIRMYRVRRNDSGAWTGLCGFESRLTPNAGIPTSGEIERSPWEQRAPSPSARAEQLLSCADLERWFETLRVHETPDHPVGDWDECFDPGDPTMASYVCVKQFDSYVDARPSFDQLSDDLLACGEGMPGVQRVDTRGLDEADTYINRWTDFEYDGDWVGVQFIIQLDDVDGQGRLSIKGANGSRDVPPGER